MALALEGSTDAKPIRKTLIVCFLTPLPDRIEEIAFCVSFVARISFHHRSNHRHIRIYDFQ